MSANPANPPPSLVFNNWDEAIAYIQRLRDQGYQQRGNWNLEQTALHLNDWLRFPMDGFPKPPFPLQAIFGLVRCCFGRKMLASTLASKKMGRGSGTLKSTVYSAAGQESQAVETLLATVDRFRNFEGPIQPSPLFGPMDKSTADQLHHIHFAHHLQLLEPK